MLGADEPPPLEAPPLNCCEAIFLTLSNPAVIAAPAKAKDNGGGAEARATFAAL